MTDSKATSPPIADPMARFKSDGVSGGEEQLKTSTVGLVSLPDFRKRRAEALNPDDAPSPASDDSSTIKFAKKKRKAPKKAALSFADDEADETVSATDSTPTTRPASSRPSRATTPGDLFVARPQTASALARDAAAAELARRDALAIEARVKATPMLLRCTFFSGPGMEEPCPERIRVTKGAQVWDFLERVRKVGAAGGKKDWARKAADDLMAVVDDLILPPHYAFWWFIKARKRGFTGVLFDRTTEVTKVTPEVVVEDKRVGGLMPGLTLPGQKRKEVEAGDEWKDEELEGYADDPAWIKIVDRRWYEKNRHVFPMNSWEEFDPERDYTTGVRKDKQGNAYFNINQDK